MLTFPHDTLLHVEKRELLLDRVGQIGRVECGDRLGVGRERWTEFKGTADSGSTGRVGDNPLDVPVEAATTRTPIPTGSLQIQVVVGIDIGA